MEIEVEIKLELDRPDRYGRIYDSKAMEKAIDDWKNNKHETIGEISHGEYGF